MDKEYPKLRTVNKSIPPFKLNEFPTDFPYSIGEQLIYILATRGATDIEGKEWEQIFAKAISAEWKPSNVGLDDIVKGNTAWGAKSVKKPKPSKEKIIRLISGRNDLLNSFDHKVTVGEEADLHGRLILEIYNERISRVKADYKHVRTVILIRSYDLLESVVYEIPAVRYEHEVYRWEWEKNGKKKNLYGYHKETGEKKFTWQSGGQQFTIFEKVPENKIIINIKKPELLPHDFILKNVGFEKNWITVKR